jgi:two-component system response regulator (stage 0 sporulation protein F)
MALGRILIVDDEAPVREVLTEYLAAEGYAVEAAGSGAEALTAVRRGRTDLVLLDVRMPGLDGVQVLRRIRKLAERVPVSMVTANDFDYLDRAVAAGLARVAASAPARPTEDDPWKTLARAAFGTARAMPPAGRASTGERLETAALAAARNAVGGRHGAADECLAEMQLLLDVAAELGDLPAADRALVESALEAARRARALAG